MREFLKIVVVAFAVLAGWFGYVFCLKPEAVDSWVRDARLMGLLEDYRRAKGAYPVLNARDVPVEQLVEMLASSGVNFPSDLRFEGPNLPARYVSVTGENYGLLYQFSQSGRSVTCLVEVRTRHTGWWGQPPTCPW
ncbi:hypothetical protein IVB38_34915 [Bradyrhizobium sp. 38]|uniref:hypothetical protein n=1 Tax=unclassified Bradyrhizobium TaxID=2631580 RepID=UPI001FF888B3|nr:MULTISPECIES: hypothetical protein [unclassified Bradyrhizobium]MCK1341071.1 hypothetical protein [Bradyrhizobium sp. 38]MCK1780921.1 hypothetical protein [Bradyrhizobium sp. 132]